MSSEADWAEVTLLHLQLTFKRSPELTTVTWLAAPRATWSTWLSSPCYSPSSLTLRVIHISFCLQIKRKKKKIIFLSPARPLSSCDDVYQVTWSRPKRGTPRWACPGTRATSCPLSSSTAPWRGTCRRNLKRSTGCSSLAWAGPTPTLSFLVWRRQSTTRDTDHTHQHWLRRWGMTTMSRIILNIYVIFS